MGGLSAGRILTVTLNPCLDRTARVERLVPGGLNRVLDSRTDPGGKGINVARVLKRFGAAVTAAGLAAGSGGETLCAGLERAGIPAAFCRIPGETRINLKILDGSNGSVTEVNEPGCPVSPESLAAFRRKFTALARDAQFVVLSGSVPPGVPADIYRSLARAAENAGAKVVLDADGDALREGLKAAPFAVKPNRDELERLAGRPLRGDGELAAAARELLEAGVSLAAVSLGADGALVAGRSGFWRTVPWRVSGGNATGAGDSMTAALVLSARRGDPLPELARFATAAGTVTASKPGTELCTPEEVRASLGRVAVSQI